MTAVDVEVQVGTATLLDVDVAIEPPTFTVVSVLPTGPRGPAGPAGPSGDAGSAKVWDGTEYVDGSAYFGPEDPLLTDPTLEAAFWFDTDDTSGGGGIESVVAGTKIDVDITDPANPVVSLEALVDVDIPATIARDAEVTSAIDALSSVYQPLDSDLTALAALTTTAFGRALLELANAAAGRTALGLGTAATSNTGDFDAAGAAAAAQAASQPVDSDLTAIAALTTTAFGRSLLALADAAALRTSAGLVIGTDVLAHSASTGTGNLVRETSPTIVTPTIASLANATHTHQSAAGGGTLDAAAIAAGTVATARLGSGTASAETYHRGDQTWANPVVVGVRNRTGDRYTPGYVSANASVGSVGDLRVMPIVVRDSCTLDRLGIRTGNAGVATCVVRLGLWADSNGKPGTLLVDAGTVDGTVGNSLLEATISQAVTPGIYWLGAVIQVVATSLQLFRARGSGLFVPTTSALMGAVTAGSAAWTQSGVTGALANFTGTALDNEGFVMNVRVA